MSQRENELTEFTAVPDATLAATAAASLCGQTASSASWTPSQPSSSCGGNENPMESILATIVSPEPALSRSGARGEEREAGKGTGRMEVSRCMSCRRRVGLMGFRCRCGELFCGVHRYSDRHECGFDYKAAGREAIARANPVVKAAKMVKI